MKHRVSALALVCALALMAAICSARADEPKVLRLGVAGLPAEHANPYGVLVLPGALPMQAIFDSFTAIGADGAVLPALATGWKRPDPNTWVFTLRHNVTFSDGEPFNAAAVVSAVEYLISPGSQSGPSASVASSFLRWKITGAVTRADDTVAITTSEPDVILPQHLASFRIPAPKAWAAGSPQDFARNPVGTGPFTVTRWDDNAVVLTANAKSWHRPRVQEIEIRAVPDQTARTQGLHAGTIDIALGLAPEDRASVEAEGGRLKATLSPAVEMAAFITATPGPVQDVRVRRALNYAVNKERIIATILGGGRTPAAQIANPQAIGFNPALKPYPYDPARAKTLLAEAGVAQGFALPTLLAANSNDTYAVYQQIAADLAKVNVTMELQRSTQAKRLEYMYQGGWPVLAFDVSETGFDPLRFYRIRSCAWSHPFQCDHDIMPLIDAATKAANDTERNRLTQRVMEYEFKNPPGIFLWQTAQFDGLGPRVKNYNVIADVVQFDEIDLRPNVATRPE